MEYLLFVGIVQALFTSVFLVSKRKSALGDKVLAVWMVFIALPLIAGVTVQLWPDIYIPVLRSDLIYPLTYGPFLWLYIRAITGETTKITKRDLIHFAPFIAVSVFQILSGWSPAPPNPNMTSFEPSIRIVGAVNLIVMLFYFAAVLRRLRQHEKEIIQHYSSLPNRITLRWLFWLTTAIFAGFFLLFLASFLSLPSLLRVHLPAQIVIILVLSFFGLRQTQVFDDNSPTPHLAQHQPDRTGTQPESQAKERYNRSGLSEEQADKIHRKLEAFMADKRPYLSADLTIAELAKQMSVSRHHLTEVISTRHNKNFYVFVNEYRIEAVKQAMLAPDAQDMTLLDLAYANGFNSKSPFNAAFKRLTGLTPSQYRQQLS